MIHFGKLAAAASSSAASMAGSAAGAQTVLRSSDTHPDGYPTVEAVQVFRRVGQAAHRRPLCGGGVPTPPSSAKRRIRSSRCAPGVIDLNRVSMGPFNGLIPESDVPFRCPTSSAPPTTCTRSWTARSARRSSAAFEPHGWSLLPCQLRFGVDDTCAQLRITDPTCLATPEPAIAIAGNSIVEPVPNCRGDDPNGAEPSPSGRNRHDLDCRIGLEAGNAVDDSKVGFGISCGDPEARRQHTTKLGLECDETKTCKFLSCRWTKRADREQRTQSPSNKMRSGRSDAGCDLHLIEALKSLPRQQQRASPLPSATAPSCGRRL